MGEKVNILVVDDEEIMRNLLCDVLTEAGYNVEAVSCGGEAIEKVQQEKFPIVVTDLKMPGMNGIEVIKGLRAINSGICVIVITAYPSIDSVIEAMREGIYDYIVKPFNIEELKLVIHRAAERQYLLHEAGQKEFYKELSILDGLTGVYNHRYFQEILLREIERARRYGHSICLLMIDLDDFKKYNDTHGHLAGDKLLREFAELFISAFRAADTVFRYGGEEFVIIHAETLKQGGVEVAKRILNLTKRILPVSISIGLSCFPDDAKDKDELIKRADEALYQAKRLGKNRICIFGQSSEQ
jgi:diguanylate cyclase (GGDEF)-like protein